MALGIECNKTKYRVGEAGAPVFTATGSSGSVRWTTSFGACVPDDALETTLALPNESHYAEAGDPVVVTLTDLSDDSSVTFELDVYATFPVQPDWSVEGEVNEETDISQAEDNGETIFDGELFATFPYVFTDREFDVYREALRFRAFHGKRKLFYVEDGSVEELLLGRFDSAIKRKPDSANAHSFSFVFRCNSWSVPTEDAPGAWNPALYGDADYGDTL